MIVGSNILAGASGQAGYFLQRSVRLRLSASGYFTRIPATTTNRRTFTWSGWIKRGILGTVSGNAIDILGVRIDGNNQFRFYFTTSDQLDVYNQIGGTVAARLLTTAVYRDPSAWYHIVLAMDTTNATAGDRMRLYVNGVEVTAFGADTQPSLNYDFFINTTNLHGLGYFSAAAFDGYLTEINFVDGQQLTPTSFGEYNTITGVWQPKKYGGTYGTNGYYLNFNDNSAATAAAIGKDSSGNGNNWTPNNISVTAGVTYDSMTDVPTLTSVTTANYAVMNPLEQTSAVTLSNANLSYSCSSGSSCRATMGTGTTGLYYFEHTITSTIGLYTPIIVGATTNTLAITNINNESLGLNFYTDSSSWQVQKRVNGTITSINVTGTSYPVNGNILQIAYDATNGKAWLGKNNNWIDSSGGITGNPSAGTNPTFTFTAGQSIFPCLYNVGAPYSGALNCGQRPFTYTPPTGFKALNTYNLPTPTIANGATQFAATLWTGTGVTRNIDNSVNGKSFQPDLVWLKIRSSADSHGLFDSVRGASKRLQSNDTGAEATTTAVQSAFLSNGFTVGTDVQSNGSGSTYVGWQWKASNAAPVTNTSGSITSSVSANPSAGFSIVTYTGTGANATVGHGLGIAPKMVIVKSRNNAGSIGYWAVWHTSIPNTDYLLLQSTDAKATSSLYWNSTSPTSTVFSLGSGTTPNASTATYVAYCFSEIAGYSKFGSYTGNASTNGAFIYTGFRPRFILIKNITTAGYNWMIMDTSRLGYNVNNYTLSPNLTGVEQGYTPLDILSNGFKIRTTDGNWNVSGNTYIYAAFAESSFNYSLAR